MERIIGEAGPHRQVVTLDGKDVNGRFMVRCSICKTCAHAYSEDEAVSDLCKCACAPNCPNCENLSSSCSIRPAVPMNGTCNDRLHVCPNDGKRWWQANGYYHHWQQVTSDRQWRVLEENLRDDGPNYFDGLERVPWDLNRWNDI